MSSQPSKCQECGQQGRWDDHDLWAHDNTEHALACDREGFDPFASVGTEYPDPEPGWDL